MFFIDKSIHCLHTVYIVEIQGSAAWAAALQYTMATLMVSSIKEVGRPQQLSNNQT